MKRKIKHINRIETIKGLMKKNNGYITTKELERLNIHRMYPLIMLEKGIIERVAPGIYIDSTKMEDNYYVFSLSTPNAIFSHMTALYFHGLSIKAPNEKYDITVKRTYNNSKLKNHEIFYVSDNVYELGLTELETPMGNKIKAYDMERCICDIIKSKNRMDSEYIKYSVKEYLKRKDKNLAKLSEYANVMGIRKKVMDYVSMMYD